MSELMKDFCQTFITLILFYAILLLLINLLTLVKQKAHAHAPSFSPSTTVNINQITDLVAAKLSPSGNPLSLSSEIATGSATATTSAITSASSVVHTALQPLFTAVNVSSFRTV